MDCVCLSPPLLPFLPKDPCSVDIRKLPPCKAQNHLQSLDGDERPQQIGLRGTVRWGVGWRGRGCGATGAADHWLRKPELGEEQCDSEGPQLSRQRPLLGPRLLRGCGERYRIPRLPLRAFCAPTTGPGKHQSHPAGPSVLTSAHSRSWLVLGWGRL